MPLVEWEGKDTLNKTAVLSLHYEKVEVLDTSTSAVYGFGRFNSLFFKQTGSQRTYKCLHQCDGNRGDHCLVRIGFSAYTCRNESVTAVYGVVSFSP